MLIAARSVSGMRARLTALAELSDFFGDLAVTSEALPEELIRTVKRLAASERYLFFDFPLLFSQNYLPGANVRELWGEAAERSETIARLSADEKTFFRSFPEVFGGTAGGFSERCRAFSDRFRILHADEKAKFEKNGTLTASLTVLAAVTLIVIFV